MWREGEEGGGELSVSRKRPDDSSRTCHPFIEHTLPYFTLSHITHNAHSTLHTLSMSDDSRCVRQRTEDTDSNESAESKWVLITNCVESAPGDIQRYMIKDHELPPIMKERMERNANRGKYDYAVYEDELEALDELLEEEDLEEDENGELLQAIYDFLLKDVCQDRYLLKPPTEARAIEYTITISPS